MPDTSNTDPRVALATKRTTLASFRTAQALDRTTLAWVRTTLTMGSFGFAMIGFFRTLEERAQTPDAIRLHHGAIRFGKSLAAWGKCSHRISQHFTLEHASPHGAWRDAKGGRLAVEHNSCAVCRSAGSGGTVVGVYLALRSTCG